MTGQTDPGSKQRAPHDDTTPEGGNYDVIRRRLLEQASELRAKTDAANAQRKKVFGSSELALASTERVRTENNCLPRDVVSINGHLLFGFQVFLGLKSETDVSDVFALYRFARSESGVESSPVGLDAMGGFMQHEDFTKTFRDAFKYAKSARLLQLRKTENRLLAIIQVGDAISDVRVFRFAIDAAGHVTYMDARGEEDAVLPRPHDFEWTPTRREDQVPGPFPHINVLNEVFVETIGGDLTVKVENNTKDGQGIYREPVEDPNQTLDDSDIAYARIGIIILLRVRPFREKQYRYLVYNVRTQKVVRIDAIEQACLQLPEDHGIIFPGGYYLRTGETKSLDSSTEGLHFERIVKSPNGEDVLYVFHRPEDGLYSLLAYNIVRKEVANPLVCNGYSIFEDGTMLLFRASDEASRVHPMQVWSTPFTSAEFAASAPTDGSYMAKVGNADLVRGISDAYSLVQMARNEQPSRQNYEDLIAASTRFVDTFFWVGHEEVGDLRSTVDTLRKTSELIIDEFEKMSAIRKRARDALETASEDQKKLIATVRPEGLTGVDQFMGGLMLLGKQRGHLITLKEMREMDLAALQSLEMEVSAHFDTVSQACVGYLLKGEAFRPVMDRISVLMGRIDGATKVVELQELVEQLDQTHEGLNLLSETISGLRIDDATQRTVILAGISEVFGQVNRARASFQARKRELGSTEAKAEFAAQFALFGQSVSGALALCDSPEKCDEQSSRMLVQLEELEGRFGEFDEFIVQLATRREEVLEAFESRRQALVDERQRRVQNLFSAAERILGGIARRTKGFASLDELNAYFASDAMVQKLEALAEQLYKLGDSVKAEEVRSKLKASRQDSIRALRDKSDLYEDGDAVIKLGRHRFSVNTQALELTLLPRDGNLMLHLTGTGFYDAIEDKGLNEAKDLWNQDLVSETPEVYRGEYLAGTMLINAEEGRASPTLAELQAALVDNTLPLLVRAAAAERYDEGYERGVHDEDAAKILAKLLTMRATVGLLRYPPTARAYACLYWAYLSSEDRQLIHRRGRSLGRLRERLGDVSAQEHLADELRSAIAAALGAFGIKPKVMEVATAARYLVQELALEHVRFDTSADAVALRDGLMARLEEEGSRRLLEEDLRALEPYPAARYSLAHAYLAAYIAQEPSRESARYVMVETVSLLLTEHKVERDPVTAMIAADITGMLGQHPRILNRVLKLRLDEFLDRVGTYLEEQVPRYRAYRHLRGTVVDRETKRLRLSEFAPKVLTSFVRNKLIDEVYLPLVGTNLAKQLGALGAGKRTDLMGLLLLISPPGYGKTTLMEYVASKLGLVFVKVNGPALGHGVVSIDPAEAPNATARQEVEKINFALEMGNNVMLYLDDIQHTHPELLQKFISLCDAQRRIEGVWKGETRTYDLRGKRFCVVMAGNPYTESGAKFQIPDMLANRADTYNLGEVLEGKDDLFALSYLENALTSNPILAPLAGRDPNDVYRLIRLARGESAATTELSYAYAEAEVAELTATFKHLLDVQAVLLQVNRQYILSASQEEQFRTETSFKLQGSYRNMNKIAEKVVPAMNQQELQRLIDDHYQSESQTLTTGAEVNLLKLAELRGRMTEEQKRRWSDIKNEYVRVKRIGGKDDDPVARVTGTLSGLDAQLQAIRDAIDAAGIALNKGSERAEPSEVSASLETLPPLLERIDDSLRMLAQKQLQIHVTQDAPPGWGDLLTQQVSLIRNTLVPLVNAALAKASASGETPAAVDGHMQSLETKLASLVAMAQTISEHLESSEPTALARFDVTLTFDSPANFFSPASGGTIEERGGLFVATYAKAPAVGTPVIAQVTFPSGDQGTIRGSVAWVWEAGLAIDPSRPVGFAMKMAAMNAATRNLIRTYAKHRAPMLVEGV